MSRLYVLEMSGVPPEDTVVTFPAGSPRTIVIRHGPPDYNVFAELVFPDSVFRGAGVGSSVTVVVSPRPGLYAVDVATTYLPSRGAVIRFKYPVHFSAPVGALQKYGGAVAYERALVIATLVDGTRYALLASRRPASDNLEGPLSGPGTYLVAAAR